LISWTIKKEDSLPLSVGARLEMALLSEDF